MERVTIRPITNKDTDNIVLWRNNPQVLGNFIDRNRLTKEIHETWIHTKIEKDLVRQFIIVVGNNDVGTIYLRDIDKENQKAEYGIFIGLDEYLGRGIGSEAGKLILDYAFLEMKLNKVFLRVLANNNRAIESYKKIGFVEDGKFRQEVKIEGFFWDVIFMSILSSEWPKLQSSA